MTKEDKKQGNEVAIVIHGSGSVTVKSGKEDLDKCYEIADEIVHKILGMLKGPEAEFEERKRRVGIG